MALGGCKMFDTDLVKLAVTVVDILDTEGIQHRRGRSACPLHHGTNPTSFAFTGEASSLGTIVAYAYDEEYLQSAATNVELTSDAPTINSLAIDYGYHTAITITGQVIDDDPDGLTVYTLWGHWAEALREQGCTVVELENGLYRVQR